MKIRRGMRVVLVVIRVMAVGALLQCFGAAAWAQAINGVVKDSSGAVLPGVAVVAASPVLIEKMRTVVTDSGGQYKLVGLLPGTYSVTYTLQGFSTVKRDGIALTADFTATVDIVLAVGSVTQTVEVTGAAPLADVADVNAETTISQSVLATMPISRNPLGFAAVTVGGILPLTGQDVGGSKGEIWILMSMHGGHGSEQKLLLNGMVYNSMIVAGRLFFPNSISTEEFTIANGEGGSAEAQGAGANVNTVSKDGGNQFHGLLDMSGTTSSLQGSNLTPYLQSRGATSSSRIDKLWDFGAGVGGRIIKDRLWFYAAFRNWGDKELSPSLQYNANPNSYTYTPNGVPVLQNNLFRNENFRLTWQATPRNKFTFENEEENGGFGEDASGNLFGTNPPRSPEADNFARFTPESITQITWTMPVNTKLLLDAGAMYYYGNAHNPSQPYVATNGISVTDSTLGIVYRAPTSSDQYLEDPVQDARFAASYVTGSHNYKFGGMLEHAWLDEDKTYNPSAVSYTFNNGVPTSITEYAAGLPRLHQKWVMWPTIGLFAQDQWTIKQRLTLSYGLRYDHRGDYVPANSTSAGVFVPARTWAYKSCVPCWNDINPRVGAAYDLFGGGKTVIKASIGRYVLQQTVQLAQANDPTATVALSTTRSWTDNNHNFIPDCNLQNVNAQGPTLPAPNTSVDTCGADANSAFGSSVVTTTYDPKVLNGWQHSPYDWQMSAGVQQMIGSNMVINATYYRTWYGNFTVTDNLDTPPADYSPYCFTAPVNVNLPGGGGNQICGLDDLDYLNPANPTGPPLLGQVQNYVTFAKNFGKQTEIYNGVDLVARVRLLDNRLQLNGGVSIGDSSGTTSSQSDCFVVNSPQQLYQCNQPYPYQAQVKFQGLYRLPWGIEFSGTEQNLPGAQVTALYAVPNSLIAPSLGRNLSACGLAATCNATASVQLIQPDTKWEARVNQLDLQIAKTVRIRERVTVKPTIILANVLNASSIEAENVTYGSKWRTPTSVLDPRLVRFSVRAEF